MREDDQRSGARECPPTSSATDADGEAARAAIGKEAYELNVQQFCCAGLNFGYFYDGSPIIAYDGEAPPAYSMGEFTPSTVPGCRAPHFWLARRPLHCDRAAFRLDLSITQWLYVDQ